MKRLLLAAVLGLFAGTGHAATLTTLDFGWYLQSGEITNTHSATITGFKIDFVADDGRPSSAVWDTRSTGRLDGVVGTYLDTVTSIGAFAVEWTGLSIGTGQSARFSGLDYDGWTGRWVSGALVPALTGEEYATIYFDDGTSATTFFTAGSPMRVDPLVFGELDALTSVPVPAGLPLLLAGIAGLGLLRRLKQRA